MQHQVLHKAADIDYADDAGVPYRRQILVHRRPGTQRPASQRHAAHVLQATEAGVHGDHEGIGGQRRDLAQCLRKIGGVHRLVQCAVNMGVAVERAQPRTGQRPEGVAGRAVGPDAEDDHRPFGGPGFGQQIADAHRQLVAAVWQLDIELLLGRSCRQAEQSVEHRGSFVDDTTSMAFFARLYTPERKSPVDLE